jgi:hypothetical protein
MGYLPMKCATKSELKDEVARLLAALEMIRDGTYPETKTAWEVAAETLAAAK